MKDSELDKSVPKTSHFTTAECLLVETQGRYFYGEALNKFIEIKEWEYRQILSNPFLHYFSTALKKHYEWRSAQRGIPP